MTERDAEDCGYIAIEFENADRETAGELKALFADDDFSSSHAFGGADIVTIITTLGGKTIGKLIDFFTKRATTTPKTSFIIGKDKFTLTGYTAHDVETLLASPNVKAAIRAARKA